MGLFDALPAITPGLLKQRAAAMAIPAPTLAPVSMGGAGGVSLAPTALPDVQRLPTQLDKDTASLNSLQNTPAGIDTINNPFLRNSLKGVLTAASVFAPVPTHRLLTALPGTNENHDLKVHQAQQTVANDQQQQLANAKIAGDQADTESKQAELPYVAANAQATATQKQALATQENAKAQAILNPQPDAEKAETLQQEHADAVIDAIHRGVDPATDTHVQQLADSITALQKQPTAKEPNKDDKYIAINAKVASGQPLTSDETAFKSGYEHFVKVNKIDPAAVRVNAMLQMPQAIADPNDPSREIYTTRRGAIGQEAPGSGDAAAARRMETYMTSGKGGQMLNAFNTSQGHLQILKNAGEALQNGNLTALNSVAQSFAKATGSAAPTNFDAIKNAAEGEVAKAFTGNATVAEQHELHQNISKASSPAQLNGVIDSYINLLESKKGSLKSQFEAGTKGRPDFQGGKPATHDPLGIR